MEISIIFQKSIIADENPSVKRKNDGFFIPDGGLQVVYKSCMIGEMPVKGGFVMEKPTNEAEHAYMHAHGIAHTHGHGHVHENQKAVLNRLARAIGHLE